MNLGEISKIHKNYTEQIQEYIFETVELLVAAKSSLGNHIGKCGVQGCTSETLCDFCSSWQKKWDEIDRFIQNRNVGELEKQPGFALQKE